MIKNTCWIKKNLKIGTKISHYENQNYTNLVIIQYKQFNIMWWNTVINLKNTYIITTILYNSIIFIFHYNFDYYSYYTICYIGYIAILILFKVNQWKNAQWWNADVYLIQYHSNNIIVLFFIISSNTITILLYILYYV